MRSFKVICLIAFWFTFININSQQPDSPPVVRSYVGDSLITTDSALKIKLIGQKHGFGKGEDYDADIRSPKSASFLPDGSKFYVNSLEGCKTVAYQTNGFKKIKTIDHEFESGEGPLWLQPSGYYKFTHYPEGEKTNFKGKPVEEAITKDGRYMFVPYYRRTFDINAQDPSALAVIDTRTDSIILMTETGPLPKMVTISNDGKLLAITHWGDNTVGFLDISDVNPKKWHHLPPVIIGHRLKLNYSLTESIDRDSGSGYALRGTIFLPGDSILLVTAMGGSTAIVDVRNMKYLGMIPSLTLMRHIVSDGETLYMSRNASGEVYSVPVESVLNAVRTQKDSRNFKVEGIKKVKVGGGARTLKLSPDGNYIFVACNSSSALYIVDAKEMKTVGQLPVDSYPVGLDVSPNGKYIVVTSQGRSGKGGNAVNIFEITNLKSRENTESAAIVIVSPVEFGNFKKKLKMIFGKKELQTSVFNSLPLIEIIVLGALIILAIFEFFLTKPRKEVS